MLIHIGLDFCHLHRAAISPLSQVEDDGSFEGGVATGFVEFDKGFFVV